ncbi:hypothetical protein D3C71_1882430 [compost metagenome]
MLELVTTELKLSDLQPGMQVTFKNGKTAEMGTDKDFYYVGCSGFRLRSNFKEDLTHRYDPDYDIVAVHKVKRELTHLWTRPVEVSVEELLKVYQETKGVSAKVKE